MPLWVSILIKLALRFGLPWLEKHVPPAIAQFIEDLLKYLGEAKDQGKAMDALNKHCEGLFCPSTIKQ